MGFDRDSVLDNAAWGVMLGSVSHGLLAPIYISSRSRGVCMGTVAFV